MNDIKTNKSFVITNTDHYSISFIKNNGLVVQNRRTGKGKLLGQSSEQFKDWYDMFTTETDNTILNDLCRGFLN